MATIQEMQKARDLMKTDGLDLKTAVAQVRTPATTAPLAPVAPAPLSVNQQVRADNIAERQAVAPTPAPVAPVAPTPMVQAPVDPTTGLSKPLEATVQPTQSLVTPTPTKDPTPGINPDTYAQANAESEKIKAQNQGVLDQNKQKSDLTREDNKLAQDQANNALASNEGAILNTLKTGGIIPEAVKSSPYYQTAQQTYNKLQQYANYSTGDIVTAMNNGSILPGTALYNEMMKDPAMKQKLTDANIYRSGKPTNEVAIYENKSSEILANNPQTSSMFADGLITQEEYAQATNNADIVAKAKDKEEKTNKYNTLYAEYEAVDDKVKAEFPGSPFADAIAADIKKAKYKDVILAKGEMDSAIGTLTDLKAQSASLFETNLKLYESRRAEQQQIAGEQRQVQAQKDMLQYKSDFEKKQAQEALNDPATAIKTVMDEMTKIGVNSKESLQTKIQKAKDYVAKGGTLAGYIDEMKKLYTDKPEYKAYLAKQGGSGDFSVTKIGTDANGKDLYGTFNKNTGTYTPISSANAEMIAKYPNDAGLKNNNPAGLTWGISSSLKQKFTDAGIQFTQGTARPKNEGGNYIGFATPEDGIKAHQIALATGGSDDIYSRLKQWVGTSNGDNYATQIMSASGLTKGDKFSQLNQTQMQSLVTNQIKRESPGFSALMSQGNTTTQDNLDTSTAELVANYKLSADKLNVLKKDPAKWQDIINQVVQINPQWSDSDYANNLKTVVQYGPSGKIGLSLKSLNTVMGHLGSYLDNINKYNEGYIGPAGNYVLNNVGSAFGGVGKTVLSPISTNIGDETAKFFGGGTSSAGDRETRKNEVSLNATPDQAKAFVQTQMDQLGSQTRTWNEQYKNVTGHYMDNILTPNAVKNIQDMNTKYNLGIKISDITGNLADDANAPVQSNTAPVPVGNYTQSDKDLANLIMQN